ncbi:sugar transferase [Reichenbachiella sp. MALMAid0571]
MTDKIIAIALLILLSPIIIIIALILYFTHGKVFFTQTRPGYLERPFRMYKFITMTDDNAERVTPFGQVLRKVSLDEIPQLWNIIRGDMSFIGPRPFLMEYLSLYSDYHKKRHYVMPGITGLAQVTGRNDVAWPDKLDLDVYYSDNLSFFLDCKIVLLTIVYFIKGCPGSYPATKFSGYHS